MACLLPGFDAVDRARDGRSGSRPPEEAELLPRRASRAPDDAARRRPRACITPRSRLQAGSRRASLRERRLEAKRSSRPPRAPLARPRRVRDSRERCPRRGERGGRPVDDRRAGASRSPRLPRALRGRHPPADPWLSVRDGCGHRLGRPPRFRPVLRGGARDGSRAFPRDSPGAEAGLTRATPPRLDASVRGDHPGEPSLGRARAAALHRGHRAPRRLSYSPRAHPRARAEPGALRRLRARLWRGDPPAALRDGRDPRRAAPDHRAEW
jgi:hypothetical protein